ncbi:MAG: SDR family oxidoreductase [SAR324 cluster bacterium]|nr:SDR family oxidoreductase [SAR324 cluster bacterium]MCZ6533699.1 SDR family oxidoreductase [SAR324 cluster bacterium]MCZ6559094.1 SDR family oxidoreductase [SAR324 cluster bacterium]MCZ6628751.1 SDR family oxidoreductase [SAR324 cluster bacterium]MCZ6645291.1 SDR family oxidoreductase [SAR324 cluster bacterium]
MELKDKVAVITGATSGIGAAVARNLGEVGTKFVLSGRREALLRNVAGELAHAEVLAGEITDPALPERLIARALEIYGRCDIVINNAGMVAAGDIASIDVDRVCEMVRVNVEGAYRMVYVALKHFQAAGGGHLINTSSVLGGKVRENVGAYCGTKHALEALTESLRMELAGTNIRVGCVAPGLVVTDLHRHLPVHPAEQQGFKTPLQPEDVARSVRFMLEQPDHVNIPRVLLLGTEQAV